MKKLRFLLAFPVLLFVSCAKDVPVPVTGNVALRFTATMNGQPIEMNRVFSGPNGQRISLETFRFYISDILFDSMLVKDVALVDFSPGIYLLNLEVPEGTYRDIRFGVGVEKSLNGTGDTAFHAASYPASHPLSIHNGMYWTWATGYIFARIEGRIDTSQAQNRAPDFSFLYHPGTDSLYGTRTFSDAGIVVKYGSPAKLNFTLEFNDVFRTPSDTIRMTEQPFTHTTNQFTLAQRVMTNLRQAIRKF